MIEIKKANNSNISRDRRKLEYFTLINGGQLQYTFGLLILISCESQTVRGEFFENGERSKDRKIDEFSLV